MPEDRLEKALNDVPADSSSAQDNQPANQDPAASPGGEQGSTGEDGKQEGRTLDNVRGELIRKLEQRDDALDDLRAELRALRQHIANTPEPQANEPVNQGNKTIDQMSIAELRTLKRGLPEDTPVDQKQQLDDYILERMAEEKARDIYRDETTRDRYTRLQKKANEKALSRWPELRKRSGEFFARVNSLLQDRGRFADNDPQAVLHAANEVGYEMGLTPSGAPVDQRRRQGSPTNVAGSSDTPVDSAPQGTLSESEIEKLSKSLQSALPMGKKFDVNRIKERDQYYSKNHNQYDRRKRG